VAEREGRGPQNLQRRFPACRQAGIPSVTRIILEETIEVIIPGNGDVSFYGSFTARLHMHEDASFFYIHSFYGISKHCAGH